MMRVDFDHAYVGHTKDESGFSLFLSRGIRIQVIRVAFYHTYVGPH